MRRILTWAPLALVALLCAACGGGAPAPKPAQTGAPVLVLDPPDTLAAHIFDFKQDTVLTPILSQWPREASPRSRPGGVAAPGEPETESMIYRVQLATTKELGAAQSLRAKAASEFKQDVQIDYEVPYYKVRVGSFVSPQAAEPLLQQARKLGYQGAWAVRVRASQQSP